MNDDVKHEVVLYFEHRGRPVRLTASAKGWAQMWLQKNPYLDRERALRAGTSRGVIDLAGLD